MWSALLLYSILLELTRSYVNSLGRGSVLKALSEPAGTFFQASHHLRSNHISVQEFILSVSEENPLGNAVSDKCEIAGFTANVLLPGRLRWRQLQSQRTFELSAARSSITLSFF